MCPNNRNCSYTIQPFYSTYLKYTYAFELFTFSPHKRTDMMFFGAHKHRGFTIYTKIIKLFRKGRMFFLSLLRIQFGGGIHI